MTFHIAGTASNNIKHAPCALRPHVGTNRLSRVLRYATYGSASCIATFTTLAHRVRKTAESAGHTTRRPTRATPNYA